MSYTYDLTFPTNTGLVHVPVSDGDTVLVAGPNGVGKSALLATLYRSLPHNMATYLPGHRQINFNNGWETMGQDSAQLRLNLFSNVDHFSRYKGAWAEDQFKMVIRTLLNAEAAFNRNYRKSGPSNQSDAARDGTLRESPVDTLNLIFEAARLPVRFLLTDAGLSAQRCNSIYAIDALSDGERAALFIVSAIVILGPGGVILIDEPEKHLHPSITGVLIEAALRAKKSAIVILASHDVHLIERLRVSGIIHIRNSTITNIRPEQRNYEATLLSNPDSMPDDLKRDLLGTRSKILFVEGDHSSTDLALYGHVFSEVKISPKGGHFQVSESVRALRELDEQHWIKPYGLIDGDGRNNSERNALNDRGVFVLPCPTIENLFCLKEAAECFVAADNEYLFGKSFDERTAGLSKVIREAAIASKDEIVARRSAWLLERELSARKLSPKDIRSGKRADIVVSVDQIYQSAAKQFDDALAVGDWADLMFRLPIKNTRLPALLSSQLGASSFEKYCEVVLRQLDIQSDHSKPFLRALRDRLPVLDVKTVDEPPQPARSAEAGEMAISPRGMSVAG